MRWRSVCLILALSVLPTCGSPLVPEEDAGLVGVIVSAGHGLPNGTPGDPFQVHVKEEPEDECGIIFTVNSSTSIVDSRGGRSRSAGQSILSEGARVSVWFDLVLESCPGQSVAKTIERRD